MLSTSRFYKTEDNGLDKSYMKEYFLQQSKRGLYRIESEIEFIVKCSRHNCGDTSGNLSLNLRKWVCRCWRCGYTCYLDNEFSPEEKRSLVNKISNVIQKPKIIGMPDLIPILDIDDEIQNNLAEKAYRYCLKRRIRNFDISSHCVSISPFVNRVYFPFWSYDGTFKWAVGRSMNGERPKTLEVRKEVIPKPLYGRHVRTQEEKVILVEGVFDYFATPNSYAILGTSINQSQIQTLIKDEIKTVFVMFDDDALDKAKKVAHKLCKEKINAYPISLPYYKTDPADIGRKIISQIVLSLFCMNLPKPGRVIEV